jgi:macrolide transport system ATP-binding/permease protein
MTLVETVFRDVRFGLRTLGRSPWSTAITILSLALGIGINTAVFTAYQAFVRRPLDARRPGEMFNIALHHDSGTSEFVFSYPDYEAYRDSVRAFSGLAAFRPARVTLADAGEMIDQRTANERSPIAGLLAAGVSNAEYAFVSVVSENYFQVLGVSPLHGRTFGPRDEASVLISENYWRRRFAGDPAIVGRTVRLNGVAVTIIGVTPHDFVGTSVTAPAFWLPVNIEPYINADREWLHKRQNKRYRLFGRVAAGATAGQAIAQVAAVANHVQTLDGVRAESERPDKALVWPGSPFPLPLSEYGGLKLAILLIMFGAAMVLAVASANVGSLQLARARSREMELRTRLSLGATRAQIVRQLLTENALVGLLAGGLALLLSWGLLRIAVKAFTDAVPVEFGAFVFDVNPSLQIFAYAFVVSVIAGILSGLTPAMQSPRSALTSTSRGSTGSVRGRRLQGVLVAVQVGLSLVLMITGSMFVRGAVHSLGIETGYDAKRVVEVDFQFPNDAKYTAARKVALVRELRMRMAALPGVNNVTSGRPPGTIGIRTAAAAIGEGRQSILNYTFVQPDYFEALGIPFARGRGFDRQTQYGQSAILSESAARQIFGAENPLGRTIRLGVTDEQPHASAELIADGAAYQVIGVARDTRGATFDGSDSKQIYLPLSDERIVDRPLLIRTQANPGEIVGGVDRVMASIDPGMTASATTLEEALRHLSPFIGSSQAAAIATGIGQHGFLLALMGIYGTVSHIVALRTREVGIRMAIGAQQHDVLRLILSESTRPVMLGLGAGMALAAGVVYVLRGILYGVNAADGIYFVGVSATFLAVALLASYPPARRAMRVDPVVALRYE